MPRHPIKIEWTKVEQMAIAGCFGTEIAAAIGVHYDTLVNRCKADKPDNISDFSVYLQTKRAKGDNMLRMKQFDIAYRDGDKTMLVWLGKNRLGQTDRKEITHEFTEPPKIEFE